MNINLFQSRIPAIIACLVMSLFVTSATAQIDSLDIKRFIDEFPDSQLTKKELYTILSKAQFQPSIIEKMTRPAEGTMAWDTYRNIFLKEDRIAAGVTFWDQNQKAIESVSASSGVDATVIVGIIGVETFYGQRKGTYLVLDALYTLAFGFPKRSSYFKSELAEFIKLSKSEGIDLYGTKGSYAGAMGFCQFMPTSYTAYAVSYDEGGKRDLVNDVNDAIASVANYLKMHKWQNGALIAFEAYPSNQAVTLDPQNIKPPYSLSYYIQKGYEPSVKAESQEQVSLQAFERKDGSKEYWFTTSNFYAITRYNHSPMYALAVYQLGKTVAERRVEP